MSPVFQCRYCPAIFSQFRSLVGHYEARHNQESERYGKYKDLNFYKGNDSGCWAATNYLGHPSSCLKCPFRKCVYDEPYVGVVRAKREGMRR